METVVRAEKNAGLFSRDDARRLLPDLHDRERLLRLMADPASKALPIFHEKNLVTGHDVPRGVAVPLADVMALSRRARGLTLLGSLDGDPLFAADVSDSEEAPEALSSEGRFEELRGILSLVDENDAGLLGYAKAIAYWHRRRLFCGACASPTENACAGHMRRCRNPECGAEVFPRTDPAVIVLAIRNGQCLLGRQASWPKGMYSAIAGFVEPGENLEEAASRELVEETGVRAEHPRYFASQPWPFPASLMVAFLIEAKDDVILPGDGELEHARWFSREDIGLALADGSLRMPTSRSISFRLLEHWFDRKSAIPLKQLAGLP